MYFILSIWFLSFSEGTLGYSSAGAMSAPSDQELSAQQLRVSAATAWETTGAGALYATSQREWFEANRNRKRGPPSTHGISSSGLTTPAEPQEGEDAEMAGCETTPPPAQQAASGSGNLIQPLGVEKDAAYSITASQMGVNVQDPSSYSSWMQQRVSTRQEVLDTIRAYHTTVIRSEIQNVVLQVEGIIKQLDDKVLRTHDNLQWLASECRQDQKKLSGVQVITTGWSPDMSPEDRLFMLCWMFEQVEYFRTYLQHRAYKLEGTDTPYVWLNILQCDPATPSAGEKFSVATILTFKSWDLRQNFMSAFGGPSGTPLWRDSHTPVKGRHVRVTKGTPQFQRKLEVPIRVLLSLINESEVLESNQVVVLWKTLTIMKPQQAREFDAQAEAVARMHYYSSEGVLRGRLEVTPELAAAMKSPAPTGATEPDCWEHHWCKIVYGIQHELDLADQAQFQQAMLSAKGSGKGLLVGKSNRHWSASSVYSSTDNPFPVEMGVIETAQICYVWDEYCDKFSKNDLKVGSYTQGTYKGAPKVEAGANYAKAAASMAPPPAPAPKLGGKGSS